MDTQATGATHKAGTRADAQRRRILRAAQKCFVEHGFHAASMATIAQTADMSPGLIYRYFRSKNEIILAIIAHQLEVARVRIGELHAAEDLAAGIAKAFHAPGACDDDRMNAPLFLEMSAEATRDPQIAAALATFDTTLRAELSRTLMRSPAEGGHGLSKGITPGRALMLICLIEGLKVREAREPQLDRKLLKSALTDILTVLFAPQKPAKA